MDVLMDEIDGGYEGKNGEDNVVVPFFEFLCYLFFTFHLREKNE